MAMEANRSRGNSGWFSVLRELCGEQEGTVTAEIDGKKTGTKKDSNPPVNARPLDHKAPKTSIFGIDKYTPMAMITKRHELLKVEITTTTKVASTKVVSTVVVVPVVVDHNVRLHGRR